MTTLGFESSKLQDLRCAVTVGVFDGVHLGHRKVLERTVEYANDNGLKSVAISFSRNPKMAKGVMPFNRPLASSRITDELLVNIGIDYHCVIDFSEEMSKLSGVEFVAVLCRFCRVTAMFVGSDFSCGNPVSSIGAKQLGRAFQNNKIDALVFLVDPILDIQGRVVSSSLIRSMLQKGDIAGSAVLLGRPYCLDMKDIPMIHDDGKVLMNAGSFSELIPRDGNWKATAIAEDGRSFEIELSIIGSCLAFQLSEPVKLDRIIFKE